MVLAIDFYKFWAKLEVHRDGWGLAIAIGKRILMLGEQLI